MKLLRTCLIVVLCLAAQFSVAEDRRLPNIVLILADDLGAHDLACYGADLHETPHLDQLARQGMRFTQAYAPSTVCSPTRASILTGKHPARLHITIWSEGAIDPPRNRRLIPGDSTPDLPHREVTLARHLQAAGYLTALVGKWHLGHADFYPETHGFDINIGGTRWGAPQTFFWPYRGSKHFGGELRYVPHLEFGEPGEYLTDRLTDEALRVIDSAGDRPFFLYLAHHAPHTPIEAKDADVEYFRQKLRPEFRHQNPAYAGMIKSLDQNVGRVLARLKERGLDQQTIVIFASDNGGYLGTDSRNVQVTTNHPLRSGKGSLYEGGLRVPFVMRWPSLIPEGRECAVPVVLTDLFPTLLGAAGQALPAGELDGVDLTPLLRDKNAEWRPRSLYFHYPHYYHAPPSTPASAVRTGDWKLIHYYEDDRRELYNLLDDPGELKESGKGMPDVVSRLDRDLQDWRQRVAAALPTPNPDFKPTATRTK